MSKEKILGYLVGYIYKFLSSTWRYTIIFHKNMKPLPLYAKKLNSSAIVLHWHGDELALIGHAGFCPWLTITSDSKDGSIMDTAVKLRNIDTARGSSTRGGVKALIGLMKKMDQGNYYTSFAVDGPKGPIHKAKPGFYSVASKKNLPVYQVLVECKSRWDFPRAWNKTYLPKPFAKITIHYLSLPDVQSTSQEDYLEIVNQHILPPPVEEDCLIVPLKKLV